MWRSYCGARHSGGSRHVLPVGAAVHPELIDVARPSRHVAGDRWFVDETYLKVAGRWVYLYRAIDQHGQGIDVLASPKRDLAANHRFFARALNAARRPTEVTTDRRGVPACARRARARGVARGGAVRQQPD